MSRHAKRCVALLVALAAARDSDFDRALELVKEAQNDCKAPVDLLRTSPRDGGFASGIHTVVAALSRSLLTGRVLTLEAKGHCHQARGRKSYAATPFHDVACAYATLFQELSPCMAHWRDRGIPATRFKLSSPQIFAEHNSTFAISAVNENLQDKPPFFWASVLATYATENMRHSRALAVLDHRVYLLVTKGYVSWVESHAFSAAPYTVGVVGRGHGAGDGCGTASSLRALFLVALGPHLHVEQQQPAASFPVSMVKRVQRIHSRFY